MSILPRLAVGSIQPEVDTQAILWSLLDALEREGVRTQTFLSRACFTPHDGAAVITGNVPRHLDSWLMTPEICRQAFLRKAAEADLSIVEGRYDQAVRGADDSVPMGGSLDQLCNWLDLPRVAIVDVSRLNHCHLPARPAADAILLDRVADLTDFSRWQTVLHSLWNIPIIGGLSECAPLRNKIAALPPGEKPARELCKSLADQFLKFGSLERLRRIASRPAAMSQWAPPGIGTLLNEQRGRVRVAVAYDEAFRCYFPDTLDMLELRGATVRVFSPLRNECLPADTDIVYLGCGAPHEFADELAANQCMLMAIKGHVCSGRRIYAEGGGLAYLCQSIETPDGKRLPMVGALKAIARRSAVRAAPTPIEVTLADDSWLGSPGTKLRGYRNTNWQLEPTERVAPLVEEPDCELDLVRRHQAIGSRIHLNFAAQPSLLSGFLRPCPEALAWAGTR